MTEKQRVTDKDLYFYEPSKGHGLKHDPFNAIIAPRPIGWISSRDTKGHVNLAPYSFFNAFCLRAADHRLLLDQLEGLGREHPADRRIRLESRHHGSRQADECDRGACRP